MYTRLSDGTPLVIRPILPSDKQMLADGLSRLSEESNRRRFLSPKPSFSPSELRYLTEVDGRDHYALVAQHADDPSAIVGVARFVRFPDDRSGAEPAIVVCDALQGKGLGTQLARMLGDAARRRGIRRFQTIIASDNQAGLRLMRTLSFHLHMGRHDHGVREMVMELAA